MSEIDPQQFGRLQSQVETLIESDARKTTLLETMSQSVKAIELQLAEAKGGWRLMVGLGGIAASLGGVVTYFLHEFLKGPMK
jgi:hypothetical protein